MNSVYIVETKSIRDGFHMIESIHATLRGAEEAREDRQMIWGKGTALNPAEYYVSVREMFLND